MQITQTRYSRSALVSTIAAPGDPGKGTRLRFVRAPPPKSRPPASSSYRDHLYPSSAVSDPDSLTPDLQGGYHLRPSGSLPHAPPTPTQPRISRQNVSLVVVLERRALNFEFSYTFPLNGKRRRRRGKKRRGRSERRHGRWSQSKAGALDPEGGRAEKGIRSAEAAIISRHHYLYALEIYANAISGKTCWRKQLYRAAKGDCIC